MNAPALVLLVLALVLLARPAGGAARAFDQVEEDRPMDRTGPEQGGRGWNPQPEPDQDYPQAITLTAYWPFDVDNEDERRMEGGTNDRKGRPLHTLEDHIEDPAAHPFVSLAADYTLFPYGTRAWIPSLGVPSQEWQERARAAGLDGDLSCYVGRIVDTGGHFFGAGKKYRNPGAEPIDCCVRWRESGFGAQLTAMRFDKGDRL